MTGTASAVGHFSQLRTTQAWSLTDMTEAARNHTPAVEFGAAQARGRTRFKWTSAPKRATSRAQSSIDA